ncbi:MAG: hypothetical protein PHR66_02490 [Desulfuromonadaceae bacterium]|nr:hypothetical protein [Desulfuromonadaceae bacterium]
MRYMYRMIAILLPVFMLLLTGCGSSSNGSTADPFSSSSTTTGTSSGTIFGNISTATGKTGITLTTDRSTIDVNNGQVLVTAKIVSNGVAISGVPVTFSIVAPVNGPATIETGLTTVTTDSNGTAISRITTGNTLSTTNVIVSATAKIGTQSAVASTTFQIVRGDGVIMFTSAAGTTPGSQTNLLTPGIKEVDPTLSPAWTFMQLIPFKLTDSNGNPRVGVPVTLSVYSITALDSSGKPDPSLVKIDFLVLPISESNQETITTDSAGQGIFNTAVTLTTPPPGGVNTVDVVFKAVTNDAIPVTAYVGNSYTLSSKLPTLTIAPGSASFGSATDITFTISGGVPPYSVTSNNTARVTAALQPDGVTVAAHLVDTTAWTGSVTITATDSASQTASATVTR